MKKFFAMLLSLLCVILGLSACTNGGNSSGNGNGNYTPPSGGTGGNGNVLIAYWERQKASQKKSIIKLAVLCMKL